MTDPVREEATTGEQFAYFMVRVRIEAPETVPSFTGVVERLGTGRKGSFPDRDELLRLLTDWSRAPSKMRLEQQRSNGAAVVGGGPAQPDTRMIEETPL